MMAIKLVQAGIGVGAVILLAFPAVNSRTVFVEMFGDEMTSEDFLECIVYRVVAKTAFPNIVATLWSR